MLPGLDETVSTFFISVTPPIHECGSIVAKLLRESRRGVKEGKTYLEPLIQQRLNDMERLGQDWSDKPVRLSRCVDNPFRLITVPQEDMLQWILDEAEGKDHGIDEIVLYTMMVNFAAIHTSSNVCIFSISLIITDTFCQTFTHALYHLAANPEYITSLRDEVDPVIKAEGWSKATMQKLKKVDSFMRESLRLNGINGSTFPLIYIQIVN